MLRAALLLAGDVLVVGVLSDPVTLDPHRATDNVSAAIMANVCEPLVRFRSDPVRPEPALATSWATSDSRRWTLTLRAGVRFHDGSPLDADAVVANLEDLRRGHRFDGAAERLGPLLVSITLERPNAALLATLSQAFFGIESPRSLSPAGAAGGSPDCSGPYRVQQAGPGEIRLSAVSTHWAGAPLMPSLVFRRYPDAGTLSRALEQGAVDVTTALGPEQAQALAHHPDLRLRSATGLNVAFLSLNTERAPLDNRLVRLALARALDRPAIVADILGGRGEPARNPLPPGLLGYAAHTRELSLDRRLARRLLAEAGHPEGFETTLLTVDQSRSYMPHPRELARVIASQLGEVGVKVRAERAADWGDYLRRTTDGAYGMAVLGWEADTPDPNDFLVALLAQELVGTSNRSRYRSEAMDALLKRGRRGSDPRERAGVYRDVQELFQRDMPWIPLYHVPLHTVQRRDLSGLAFDPTGLVRYQAAHRAAP